MLVTDAYVFGVAFDSEPRTVRYMETNTFGAGEIGGGQASVSVFVTVVVYVTTVPAGTGFAGDCVVLALKRWAAAAGANVSRAAVASATSLQ